MEREDLLKSLAETSVHVGSEDKDGVKQRPQRQPTPRHVHMFLRHLCAKQSNGKLNVLSCLSKPATSGRAVPQGSSPTDPFGQQDCGESPVEARAGDSDILRQSVPQPVSFHRFTPFNPDNRCYQNAVFLAIAWAHSMAGAPLPSPYDEIFLQCARSGGMQLQDSEEWNRVMSAWPRPRSQHDAAEFLAHLLQQACRARSLGNGFEKESRDAST